MKTLLIFLFIMTSICSLGQVPDSSNKLLQHKDSMTSVIDMQRNGDNIIHLMNENSKKQKKAAMLRIAFGIALLGVLIIGLSRKTKKKNIVQ